MAFKVNGAPCAGWMWIAARSVPRLVTGVISAAATARSGRSKGKDYRNDARGIAQLMRLGLVPPGTLQVDPSAGDACAAHRAQAGAGKTS